jgi:hypothetical protein
MRSITTCRTGRIRQATPTASLINAAPQIEILVQLLGAHFTIEARSLIHSVHTFGTLFKSRDAAAFHRSLFLLILLFWVFDRPETKLIMGDRKRDKKDRTERTKWEKKIVILK